MEEGYVEAFGTLTGSLVDETAALGLHLVKAVLHTVGDGKRHMLDAAATTVVFNKLADGAFGSGAFKKLYLGLADLEESRAYFLVCYFLDGKTFESESVLIKGDCLFKVRHCDADVLSRKNPKYKPSYEKILIPDDDWSHRRDGMEL